jgi:exopolysaccharide production protein ExoZ
MDHAANGEAGGIQRQPDGLGKIGRGNAGHGKILGIQAARGVAALVVVIYHAGRMLSLPQYIGHIPLGGFFQFGHAGVDFFFVLSGFIICFVHSRDVGRRERLPRYAWRRVTRIYPIYWVVTGLVMALDLLHHDSAALLAPGHVLMSLLLLPHGQDPVVSVAWTLEHEMLFYGMFALAILSRRLGIAVFGAWAALIVAGLVVPLGGLPGFVASSYHLQFFMGIATARLVLGGRLRAPLPLAVAGAAAFLGVGLAEDAGLVAWAGVASQILFGLSAAAVVAGIASAEQRGLIRFGAAGAFFGATSYALYLIQIPVIGLVIRALYVGHVIRLAPAWATMLACALAAFVAAALLYQYVERPIMAAIRRIGQGRVPVGAVRDAGQA